MSDDPRDDYDEPASGRVAPHRGTMILIFGVLGLAMCGAFGIVAWVMGKRDLAEIAAGRMDPSGKDQTQIGYILGIVGMVIFAIQTVITTVVLAMMAGLIGAGAALN
jgi:hypothetical protein